MGAGVTFLIGTGEGCFGGGFTTGGGGGSGVSVAVAFGSSSVGGGVGGTGLSSVTFSGGNSSLQSSQSSSQPLPQLSSLSGSST